MKVKVPVCTRVPGDTEVRAVTAVVAVAGVAAVSGRGFETGWFAGRLDVADRLIDWAGWCG